MSVEQMIRESAARLFAGAADARLNEQVEAGQFPAALWQQIESAGFALALTGGEQGFGLTPAQALPIFTELGRHRIPAPLAETAIGLSLLASAGHPLPAGAGTLIDTGHALTLAAHGSTPILSGHAQAVPWARHARWALAQLPQAELAHIDLANAQGVQIEHGLDMAGLPADTLHLDRVPVQVLRPASAETFAPPMRTLGALVHAAMMVGTMQWALDQAVQYANDRIQFGRPIGKNQALQQALAQTAGDVASAHMAVQAAGLDLGLNDPARAAFGVAAAKIRCGEAATRTAAVAHQVLGAIGFTREHALHFATRRLWAWREAWGADAWWAQRLGQAAIRAGAAAFWPAMTARQFTGEPR
ncbi:MAG: acyl-CoA/acyl-ACP dehydrogenase [Burkholderiaceae bacterium]|jgi:acyl-CoA dehydrogenase|nr:acyl-CoA/acyl-ACP dehydrogenase [Burkholderiaceae bacterium]